MRLYLAQSYPEAWGEVRYTGDVMRLYLCTWEEGHGESRNPQSRLRSGTDQWKMLMKLHLAERDPQHHAWPKRGADKGGLRLRILLSYWYYKDVDLDALFAKYFTPPYPEVFADSGAFSAMTQGVPITVQEYANWLKRWQHLFSAYANLDVIKNAEATWHNQQELEDLGYSPIPAFHILEDWGWLERYIEKYPYIALGVAGQQKEADAVMRWLVKCFKLAGRQAVFHGFALTSWQIMKSFPWYSVDSSSWGSGFRYGSVPLFDKERGRFFTAHLGDKPSCYKLTPLFRALGFDPADFADRRRNERAKICAISALSYMKAERWLRGYWGEVHIPGRPDAPAVLRAHLADANPARYGEAVQGAGERLHLADTSSGINFGDASTGLKTYLGDITHDNSWRGMDLGRAAQLLGALNV